MINIKCFLNLSLILLFGIVSLCSAQDSMKVIILSDETGFLIDAKEKEEYGIIPKFGDEFIHAFFYLDNDKQYYCKVRLKSGDSFKDSVLTYSYTSIKSIAMRIQYKEKQKTSNSDIDINDFELKFADGETVRNFVKVSSSARIEEIIKNNSSTGKLPLAKTDHDYSQHIEKGLVLGLGIGIIYNSHDFNELSQFFDIIAINALEDPENTKNFEFKINSFPLYRFSSVFIIENTVMGEFEFTIGGSKKSLSSLNYHSFSVSLSYLIPLYRNLSPYFSLGYSGCSFSAVQHYGNLPIKESKGKLESITLDGASKGAKISIGAIYKLTDFVSINVYGSYRFLSPIEVYDEYNVSDNHNNDFNMSNYEIGLSIWFNQ